MIKSFEFVEEILAAICCTKDRSGRASGRRAECSSGWAGCSGAEGGSVLSGSLGRGESLHYFDHLVACRLLGLFARYEIGRLNHLYW